MTTEDRALVRAAIAEKLRIEAEIARLRRERSQLTVRSLAQKLGYSTRTIHKWASGVRA